MKISELKRKLVVLLTIFSVVFSFAQTDCELRWSRFTKDIDATTDIGKALVTAIDENPEVITSWWVFDTVGEDALRTNLDELSFVTTHLKTKNKTAETIVDEIKYAGSYSKWKGTIESSKDVENFYTIERALKSKDLVQEYNLMNYAAGANIDEIAAIHRYTVNNFELTDAAYSGTYSKVQQSWINLIESGLNKMRSTNGFTGTVYRGSNLEPQYLQPFIDAWESSSKILPIPPFQSTSKLESVANSFINRFKAPGKHEVMFEIQSKSGVYIDDISDYGKNLQPIHNRPSPKNMVQEEVILNKNGQYRIDNLSIITNTDGTSRYIIEMTEL